MCRMHGSGQYAEQMQLAEDERKPKYQNTNLDSLKNSLYPEDLDVISENLKLQVQLDLFRMNLGSDNEFVKNLAGDYQGREAVDYAMTKTILDDKAETLELLSKSPEEILNSKDPIIHFIKNTSNDNVAL